jgi:hypothetical protein
MYLYTYSRLDHFRLCQVIRLMIDDILCLFYFLLFNVY